MKTRIKIWGAILLACTAAITIAIYAVNRPMTCANLGGLYVENPRFTPMSSDKGKAITTSVAAQFKTLLSPCVAFKTPDVKSIGEVFGQLTIPPITHR